MDGRNGRHRRRGPGAALALAAAAAWAAARLAGCAAPPVDPGTATAGVPADAAADPVDAALGRAAGRPLLILVTEPGAGDPSAAVRAAFDTAAARGVELVHLDLAASRNRATAARFRPVQTPLLVTLSAGGVIASRDEGAVTPDCVAERATEAARRGPELDAKLGRLRADVAARPDDPAARLALGQFYWAHRNAREAIPPLAAVARDASLPADRRTRAWVDLALAHRWATEPEKARHEARAVIATLGPTSPEARAGGSLVLGLLDVTAKRVGQARAELRAAVEAAPESEYAREAAAALAALPPEGTDR